MPSTERPRIASIWVSMRYCRPSPSGRFRDQPGRKCGERHRLTREPSRPPLKGRSWGFPRLPSPWLQDCIIGLRRRPMFAVKMARYILKEGLRRHISEHQCPNLEDEGRSNPIRSPGRHGIRMGMRSWRNWIRGVRSTIGSRRERWFLVERWTRTLRRSLRAIFQ